MPIPVPDFSAASYAQKLPEPGINRVSMTILMPGPSPDASAKIKHLQGVEVVAEEGFEPPTHGL
jgi:hypothetical protein